MRRFNLIKESICSLYHDEEETLAHLFFDCRNIKPVWTQILQWLNVDHQPKAWHEEIDWVVKYVSRKGCKSSLMQIAFIENLHGIWLWRNVVIFGHDMHTNVILPNVSFIEVGIVQILEST